MTKQRESEMARWFRDVVETPAREDWGSGWARLSSEQRVVEIQAKAWVVLTSSGRVEDAAKDDGEAAALGRHVLYIMEGLRRWRSQNDQDC